MAGPVNQEGSVPVLQALLGSRIWWLGLVLAVASYLGLHTWAAVPPPELSAGVPMAPLVAVTMSRMLADFAQYIVPVVVLFIAGVLAMRSTSDVTDFSTAARGRAAMAAMDWPEFESLLKKFFGHQGFSIIDGFDAGADGSADVMIKRGSERFLVRAKSWHAQRVGVQPVRELFSVIASSHASGGFMVTSGIFTPEAHLFAQGREVVLVDGQTLHETIRKQSGQTSASDARAATKSAAPARVPSCPLCGAPMVVREFQQGQPASKSFWRCSKYPQTQCRGTREVVV